MERIEEHYFESLGLVRLYRDDIENIFGRLADACEEVTISAGGFSFTDPARLAELNQDVLYDIEFQGRNPTIHAGLKHDNAHLFASSDDALSRGILAMVRDVIPIRWNRRVWNMLAFLSAFISVILAIVLFFIKIQVPVIPYFLFIFMLMIGYPAWYWWTSFSRHTIVYLKYRREAPNFIERNKDALIVNLLVAAIVAAVTWFIASYQGQSPANVPRNPMVVDSTPVGR